MGPPPPADSFRPARPAAPARRGDPPAGYESPAGYEPPAGYDPWAGSGAQGGYDGTAVLGAAPGTTGMGNITAREGGGPHDRLPGAAGGGGRGPEGFAVAPSGGTPAVPVKPRRRRRKLLIALVALIVLFVVGDRVSVVIAKDQMRQQVEAGVAENIKPGDPIPTVKSVSIGGFPFLTQVLFGKFTNIGVEIEGIPTPGPKISSVKANLKGVHVPLGDAITNNVGQVPVDHVRATVDMTYNDLNAYLAGQQVQVKPVDGGKEIEVTGTVNVPVLGTQQVGGITTFEVRNNMLTLVPSEVKLTGAVNLGFSVPGELLPSIPIPISGLPFHLRIVEASTNATGLSLTATAEDVVLPAS